ncbi:hypothetical protein [Mucilaginibacter sp. L196]|uniref:hypothetical protein n=1 Tax=Mucilaginibacter sp. L196 TaxID=1641870 RepID=UPI00131E0931|nr:hypothetical protein [Mucilaginibacter sp. L196]
MRENINGFEFYINPQNTVTGLLNYISSTTGKNYFDFNIATDDPAFYFFTDLLVDNIGQLIYNSHAIENKYKNNMVDLAMHLSDDTSTGYVGSLIIYFDDVIKFNDQGGFKLHISYTARATQWQYYIINSSSLQLQNPQISGKTAIDFSGPDDVILENGQEAILFSSGDNMIPLSVTANNKFDLISKATPSANTVNKGSSAKIIFKGLPVPDPMRIGAISSGGKVSSKMYVYI